MATSKASLFEIVDFVNPRTKTVSLRVQGTHPTLGRIRKNFSGPNARTAAQAWVNQHTPQPAANPPRPVLTHAPEEAVRQLEAALLRLPPGTDLLQAVDFFAANNRPLRPLDIGPAIEAFCSWLTDHRKCEPVTVNTRRFFLKDFAKAARVTRSDGIRVHPVGTEAQAPAVGWIYSRDATTRTQRDRFDLLKWFCQFLVNKKHAAANPILELDRPVHKVQVPGVLTFDETWRLLQCALTDGEGPYMLPFFAICALSGVRPDEVPRLAADEIPKGVEGDFWADVHLDEEHRLMEVNKAKGGRARRNVPIGDPLWRILTWCKERKLAPNYFSKRKFNRIRERAGVLDKWEKDILRHTYASHHYIVHKDVRHLEQAMGNSEQVLFQHYIRPVSRADGLRFEGLILHYAAPREAPHRGGRPFRPKWTQPPAAVVAAAA